MTIAIVLTLQEVLLQYDYYCGLTLQYYLLSEIFMLDKNMVGLFDTYRYQFCLETREKFQSIVKVDLFC